MLLLIMTTRISIPIQARLTLVWSRGWPRALELAYLGILGRCLTSSAVAPKTMSVLKAAQNANTAFSEIPIMSAHPIYT